MARRNIKITTESFVRIGDKLVSTKDLNQDQKSYLGAVLKTQYLNELFAGKAVFQAELKTADQVFGY